MKTKRIFLSLIIVLAAAFNTFSQPGFGEQQLDYEVFQSFDKVQPGSEFKIALKIKVKEGWHINSNKPKDEFLIPTTITIEPSDKIEIIAVKFPEAHDYKFDFSDKPVSVFEGETVIGLLVKANENLGLGKQTIKVKVNYQACNNQSCMPPNSLEKDLELNVVDTKQQISQINTEIFSNLDISYTKTEKAAKEETLGDRLEKSGLIVSLLIVFFGGLALNLTPCVYPLIPITVGYFGGQAEGKTSRLFVLGLFYLLGLAITYSIVGVVTALSGAVFGSLLQNPVVIIIIALIFVALSLSMFGLYEFKMPDSMVMKAGGARAGVLGALFMGLTMGIVAAPCIGPFVLGLVTYVGAKGDPFFGFMMFFTMSIGLGLPYLVLAVFSGKIKSLPRAGFWMEAVKHIFGFLLLGMAIYFINPLLPKEVAKYDLPIFMIGSALYLLFIDKLANDIKGFRIFKSIFSVVIIVLGIYMLWPVEKNEPEWEKFSVEVFEKAKADNQKIIIDCYADWCIACKELDALTFSDSRVIELSKQFKMLKVDMTVAGSDISEYARSNFKVKGLPTVILIDSNGNEIERITGFVDADEFLKLMKKVN